MGQRLTGGGPSGCFGPLTGGGPGGCFGPLVGGPLVGGVFVVGYNIGGLAPMGIVGDTGGVAFGFGRGSVYAPRCFDTAVSSASACNFFLASSISAGVILLVPFWVYHLGGRPLCLRALSCHACGSGKPCIAAKKLSSKKERNPNNPTTVNMNTFAIDSKPE